MYFMYQNIEVDIDIEIVMSLPIYFLIIIIIVLSVIVYVLRQNCRAAGWRWDTKFKINQRPN
jgi:hypothetical protein